MPLLLNSLFHQFEIEPKIVRLLRHKDSRAEKGRTPYELWRDDPDAFDRYQSHQSFENHSRLMPALYWASFVVTPAQDTLLAGLYRVGYRGKLEADRPWPHAQGLDLAGSCDVYNLELDPRSVDLGGRVVIEWGLGTRGWIQRADNQNKAIVELTRTFKEPDFPGFTKFIEPLSRIEGLPRGWIDALRSSKGVYLLTCPKTYEQYVGSATGDHGFWGRWRDYVRTNHGGNAGLKSRDPSDYEVSILEVAGSNATQDEIIRMEGLWKDKLRSREMGLNRN